MRGLGCCLLTIGLLASPALVNIAAAATFTLVNLDPAGTGLNRYRNVTVEATEEAKAERYPNRIFTDDASFNEADLSFVDFDSFSSDDFTPGTYN